MAEHEGVLPATEEVERARELFGLGPAPTRREVIQAWREAARLAHPDLAGPDSAKTAERLMQRINEARQVLLDALPPEPPEPAPDVFAEAGLYEPLWTDNPDEFDDTAAPPVPYPKDGRTLARRDDIHAPDMTPLQPRVNTNGSSPFGGIPGVRLPVEPQAVVEPVPPVRPVPPSTAPSPNPGVVAPVPPTPPRPPAAAHQPQPQPPPIPPGMHNRGPVPSYTQFQPRREIPVVGPTGAPTMYPANAAVAAPRRPVVPAPFPQQTAGMPGVTPPHNTRSLQPEEEPRRRRLSTRVVTLICLGIGIAIVAAVLMWISARDSTTATESGFHRPGEAVCIVEIAPHMQAAWCDEHEGATWTRM